MSNLTRSWTTEAILDEATWERVGEVDADWFKQNPGERFVIRTAFPFEIEEHRRHGCGGSPGTKLIVGIRAERKTNGYQLRRLYISLPRELDFFECFDTARMLFTPGGLAYTHAHSHEVPFRAFVPFTRRR